METEVKKKIIEKLTRKQLFCLCLSISILLSSVVVLIALLAPESLPQLFGALE